MQVQQTITQIMLLAHLYSWMEKYCETFCAKEHFKMIQVKLQHGIIKIYWVYQMLVIGNI